jgi:hypothetical protein
MFSFALMVKNEKPATGWQSRALKILKLNHQKFAPTIPPQRPARIQMDRRPSCARFEVGTKIVFIFSIAHKKH